MPFSGDKVDEQAPGQPAGAASEGPAPAAARPLAPRNIGEPEDVGDIEERMNRPLEQLKRMAHDRPDSVGLLIKSWMLEERR